MILKKIKHEFIEELNFIDNLGRKIFLCPFTGRSKYQRIGYYFVNFLIGFTSFQLFLTLYLVEFDDWLEVISIAPNVGACLMSTIKFTSISMNSDLYAKIFDHFREVLWDFIPSCSIENVEIFVKYKSVSKVLSRFIIYASVILCVVVDSFPWLIMTYEIRVLENDSPYLYPYDAWYPFDKVKWYWVAYVWESFISALIICIYGYSSILHMFCIASICMELTLLGRWLRELVTKTDIDNIRKGKNLEETHKVIRNKLRFIIKRYTILHKTCSGLDRVLGNVMLFSYVFDRAFICLTIFSALVIDDTYKTLRYFSFFLSLILVIFTHCIIGQVLIDHSMALSENIYSSYWIYTDAETKKILLLFMRRTQKPFKLTANRFVVMELKTFSRICSSSFSLFNLLRTVYEL